ncbi:MAG: two-component system response regulator [Pedosphaera sp.]|nr:two-component system response regulator [Pedosphaera sp.]
MPLKPLLLVEDDEDQAFFMQRALQKGGIPNSLQVVNDGEKAVQYLAGKGDYENRTQHPLPCLVLLDLKLPRRTGHEVLHWIRSHPTLFGLPVIVLTTSNLIKDIELAYRLGANSYLIKPMNGEDLDKLVEHLSGFWLKFNVLLQCDSSHTPATD